MDSYISKSNASKTIKMFRGHLDDKMIFRLRMAILKIPSADVKPVVRAEWIPGREVAREYVDGRCIFSYEDWRCGHCGCVYKQPYKPTYRYCPTCGAEMRPVEALKQAAAEAGADGLLPATE